MEGDATAEVYAPTQDKPAPPDLSPLQLFESMARQSPELSPLADRFARREVHNLDQFMQHKNFYWTEGNVVFLVETTLYKLFRRTFEGCEWFNAKFKLADNPMPGKERDLLPGWDEYSARRNSSFFVHWERRIATMDPPVLPLVHRDVIVLAGVTVPEFDAFLSVLYPNDFDRGDISTKEEWTSVLKLATLWGHKSVRSRAIRELDRLLKSDPVVRLALTRSHNIKEWDQIALRELSMREESLSVHEVQRMGAEDIALVMKAREAKLGVRQVVESTPSKKKRLDNKTDDDKK